MILATGVDGEPVARYRHALDEDQNTFINPTVGWKS
jgi:hypothetical protein